jgi:hypothetical protein
MEAVLQELVWERAVRRCEYCRMFQDYDDTLFQIDHIVAVCHGGPTRSGNLALACFLWFHCASSTFAGFKSR